MVLKVGILGLGQLGASFAAALHQAGYDEVWGFARRPETVVEALNAGFITQGSTIADADFSQLDLLVLGVPLCPSIQFLKEYRDQLGSLIITDVGSVKGEVCNKAHEILSGTDVQFIGSHPMTGTEKCGIEATNPKLFENRVCFITPNDDSSSDALTAVETVWQAVGMNTVLLTPDSHDELVAYTSHMVHLVSALVVQTVFPNNVDRTRELGCAGGFKDVTRVAGGNVNMWMDICKHNRKQILASLSQFEEGLKQLRLSLEEGNEDQLKTFLSDAKDKRNEWHHRYADQPCTKEC
ncbi:MAG: prephenate dehydrogenase/arogenate dehydrogenase family protein [Lentisphaeria bacterium]|nr:prephenate dehydrogenase/arogenate dehydrogenase family protein [Lentisphaeria bacterium]